ncbi:HEAT repeat domain-containing protein [Sorangium sp. So ce381]|uniref:nSTAND3 domain-containing NTPase n=1 Tax=Sorangium sp. So ce381 TaxID=3133307 RepID=UPI003F5CBB70
MAQPGRTAYKGFDYQIWVSIWLTLVFLIEEKLAQSVEVEPLTGEDLELLRSGNAEHDTSEIATSLRAVGGEPTGAAAGAEGAKGAAQPLWRYIVQIKGRRVGHWTGGDLHQILTGNDDEETKRTWPIDVMKGERDVGLLFVTDSTLSGNLGWFLVETPVFPRRAEPRPANAEETWGKHLSATGDDVLTRLGVLQGQRYDGLKAKIDVILASKLNVPHAAREPLREALFKRFRAAMLRDEDARVDEAEIRQLAQQHGGLPGGPEPFVEPDNWAEIQRVMREEHAIVLVGEPGTGKSTAAERINYEHRVMDEPFRLVTPERPSQLRGLSQEKEPLIVYVEDPFGYYEPGNDDDNWLTVLERFCASLRDDLKLVVTSRTAFAARYLDDAKSAPRLRRHRFPFGSDIFNQRRLLREHVVKEPRMNKELAAWLVSHVDEIVAALERPISYSVFVTRAADLAPEERTDARLEELLRESSIAELGKDLEKTFEREPESVRAGLAAVWVALEAWSFRHGIDKQLAFFEEALLDLGAEVSGARTKLVEHRWLRVQDGRSRMHPVYMEACFHVLAKGKALTARVVQRLLQACAEADRAEDVESVFSVVATRDLVPTAAKRDLAVFAEKCLRTSATSKGGGPAFTAALSIMAANGAKDDPLAMLARVLTQGFARTRRGELLDMEEWIPPVWATNAASLRRVAEHPDTPVIVRAFVRRGFPTIVDARHPGAERLVELLYNIVDVSAEFDALLARIDQFGAFLVDVIAHGAARSRNADPARLLARAVAEQRAYEKWVAESYPYNEDSYAASEHWGETGNEQRLPATAIVDALLAVQAKKDNPTWAATQTEPLVFERFADRVRHGSERDPDVIRRVFSACPAEMRAPIVEAILSRHSSFELVLQLLPQVPSHEWPDLLERHFDLGFDAAEGRARCSCAFVVLKAPAQTSPPLERVSLAYELRTAREHQLLVQAISERFGDQERAALSILLAEPGADARACLPILTEIARSKFSASRVALVALARAGHPLDDLIDAWLAPNSYIDNAVAALDATMVGPQARRFDRIRGALRHPRAQVRTHALGCLREMKGDDAVDAIRSMIEDATYSVRIAAADALAGRSEPAAWRTLAAMLGDSADMSNAALDGFGWRDDAIPEYSVAAAAALALAALDPWPAELEATLRAFLDSRSSTRETVSQALRRRLNALG